MTQTFVPPTERQAVRDVPAAALQMSLGQFEFADGDGETYPVKLSFRSDQPIVHWYWGRIVHDLTGFKTHKPRIPIDYCHNYDEVMGFLESSSIAVENGALGAAGELVPFAGDRVAEVRHKAKLGVPYESSVNFNDDMKLEWIDAGQKADVNGFEFEGPGVIVREWGIRGVAICPYGADKNTSAEFSKNDQGSVPVNVFKGEVMTKETPKTADPKLKPEELASDQAATEQSDQTELSANEATGDASGAPTQTESPEPGKTGDTPALELSADDKQLQAGISAARKQLTEFTAKFGAENGAKWFGEGKTYAEALELHAAAQADQISALQKKLASIDTGETDPAEFNGVTTDEMNVSASREAKNRFSQVLPERLASFADGLSAKLRN